MSNSNSILNEINRVFSEEISVLNAVKGSINSSYARAVDLISNSSGKVVITGMGKSGLISQKIVATMVSTGTNAVFLHAADAAHGDIGIIERTDVVIGISKSGETDELISVITYCNSVGATVVSITANAESTLARLSDVILYTPVQSEACPLDLAPTSSTTAALVVGDSLSVALMKLKGFTEEHFARAHPGGKLGRQLLLKVGDAMRSGESNPTINVNQTIPQLLFEISNKLCGAVSVIDDSGQLLGLVTDFDIRKILENFQDIFALNISDIMNPSPIYTYSDVMAVEAKRLMSERNRSLMVLPVLDRQSHKVTGMLHVQDLVSKGL